MFDSPHQTLRHTPIDNARRSRLATPARLALEACERKRAEYGAYADARAHPRRTTAHPAARRCPSRFAAASDRRWPEPRSMAGRSLSVMLPASLCAGQAPLVRRRDHRRADRRGDDHARATGAGGMRA